jgi:hypothetical protein
VAVVFPSLDAELRTAIADKRLIELRYKGAVRIAEPHDYGVQNGVERLLIYWTCRCGKGSSRCRSACANSRNATPHFTVLLCACSCAMARRSADPDAARAARPPRRRGAATKCPRHRCCGVLTRTAAHGKFPRRLRMAGGGRRLPLWAGAAEQPLADMRRLPIVCFRRILGTAAPGQLRPFVVAAESSGKPPLMGRPITTPPGTQLTCLSCTT